MPACHGGQRSPLLASLMQERTARWAEDNLGLTFINLTRCSLNPVYTLYTKQSCTLSVNMLCMFSLNSVYMLCTLWSLNVCQISTKRSTKANQEYHQRPSPTIKEANFMVDWMARWHPAPYCWRATSPETEQTRQMAGEGEGISGGLYILCTPNINLCTLCVHSILNMLLVCVQYVYSVWINL